jgi:hypothetical protein
VLASQPTEARAFLAKVFTGPLVFTPDREAIARQADRSRCAWDFGP